MFGGMRARPFCISVSLSRARTGSYIRVEGVDDDVHEAGNLGLELEALAAGVAESGDEMDME